MCGHIFKIRQPDEIAAEEAAAKAAAAKAAAAREAALMADNAPPPDPAAEEAALLAAGKLKQCAFCDKTSELDATLCRYCGQLFAGGLPTTQEPEPRGFLGRVGKLFRPIPASPGMKHPSGIREVVNRNPAITTGAAILVIIVGLIYIGMQAVGGGAGPRIPTQAFYTVDDGASTFVDRIYRVTPFDYGGKPAVQAIEFTADDGAHHWIQYLQKYTDDAAKKMSAAGVDAALNAETFAQILVKKPGSGDWILETDPKSHQITDPVIPNASYGTGPVTPYLPGM